jgi:hypothetical protein
MKEEEKFPKPFSVVTDKQTLGQVDPPPDVLLVEQNIPDSVVCTLLRWSRPFASLQAMHGKLAKMATRHCIHR